jgi:hypothetical protein
VNISQIKSDIDFLCGSTSATYPDADKIRNINIHYQDVARLIWESASGWQFDDSNATTLPLVKTTMDHGQQDYSLPATTQRIESVIVKDSNGNWTKLRPFDIHDTEIALPEYYETPGLPLYYDVVGRSIMLYPKPSSAYATLASGLGVYINREVTEFPLTAGTGAVPGFASSFHRILSYATALDFVQDSNARQFLAQQKAQMEEAMTRFYSKRGVESKSTIKPATRKRWRAWL